MYNFYQTSSSQGNAIVRLQELNRKRTFAVMVDSSLLTLINDGLTPAHYALHQKLEQIHELRSELIDKQHSNKITQQQRQAQDAPLKIQLQRIKQQLLDYSHQTVDTTGFILGAGGSKKFYDMAQGMALMLPNMDESFIPLPHWKLIIADEALISKRLCGYGLLTQQYTPVKVMINDSLLHTLKAPSFATLCEQGYQVRDHKNRIHYGDSWLFSDHRNITPDFIKILLKDIISDIIILLSRQVYLGGDSLNIVISDSAASSEDSAHQSQHYLERKQTVRLFFYDFSITGHNRQEKLSINLLDNEGQPDPEKIQLVVKTTLSTSFESLIDSINSSEMTHLKRTHPGNKKSTHVVYQNMKAAFNTVKEELTMLIQSAVIEHLHAAIQQTIAPMTPSYG